MNRLFVIVAILGLLAGSPRAFATDCYIYESKEALSYSGWFITTGPGKFALLNQADDAAPYLGSIEGDRLILGDSSGQDPGRRFFGTVKGAQLACATGETVASVKDGLVSNLAGAPIVFAKGESCTDALALAGAAFLHPEICDSHFAP